MIELVIDGAPTGKGRPRFDSRSRRTYTPDDTVTAEGMIRIAWMQAGKPRIDGPVSITVELVVRRPVSHTRKNGELSAAGLRDTWPIRKPDIDNALKLICDALNGCAYRDDVDIVNATLTRRWATGNEREHTHVWLREQGPA